MKTAIIALSAAALIVTAPAVFAQGVSSKAPGQEMQAKSPKKAHAHRGASAHMQAKGSKKGSEGASGYAPGQTTGSSTKRGY
jgi:hypothetical protein